MTGGHALQRGGDMPPEGYTAFMAQLRDYVHDLPATLPVRSQEDEEVDGECEAVFQSHTRSYEAGRAPRFLLALDEKHGFKAVQSFMRRYNHYLHASEEALQMGEAQPQMQLLGYEKPILEANYAEIGKRSLRVNRRIMMAGTGALLFLAGHKMDDPAYSYDATQYIIPKLMEALGASLALCGIFDEVLEHRKEIAASREDFLQFLEGTNEILEHVAAVERGRGRKPPDFLGRA